MIPAAVGPSTASWPGMRVSTENVSNAACPLRLGRWRCTAARLDAWAACVESNAATATLVSTAQVSALVGITPALDVGVGRRHALHGGDHRPTIDLDEHS